MHKEVIVSENYGKLILHAGKHLVIVLREWHCVNHITYLIEC